MKLNEPLIIYLANWQYLEGNPKLELLLQGENPSYTNRVFCCKFRWGWLAEASPELEAVGLLWLGAASQHRLGAWPQSSALPSSCPASLHRRHGLGELG